MKDRLFQLLGIEHGEESMVSMLLTQSVFLGIFYGAFDISAHSLFLSIFDEKMMARGYVISGIVGIILTGLYTWLQARVRFRNFAITNLIFVTILTLLLWVALLINPSKIIVFFVFVMFGPINILAMLGFWGTTGRLFTLRQGKRLFGLVDAGLIIGIIVSCYSIPVLLAMKFESHNILLISAASIMIAAFIQILIGSKFTFAAGKSETREKKRSSISIFREDSYIRTMGIFIALSVVTAFFVMYSFMAVTREQYPAEADMARFLGLFTGSMMIFTLLIKILVFSYLIRNYGLKTCLAITPFLVAGFTALAIIIGSIQGYTLASGGFLLFFLLLALSRLFSKSLKDSVESPSFKVIYQTVDEKIRYEVQSGIDGTINEIAALTSGLLLAGLGALSFIKLIHFSLVLFILILIWIYFALKLYTEYRKSIRRSLEAVTVGDTTDQNRGSLFNLKNRVAGGIQFRSEYYKMITGDNSALENSQNLWFLRNIIRHTGNRQDKNFLSALKKITGKSDIDEALKHESAGIIDQLEVTKGDYSYPDNLLSTRTEDEKINNARKILAGDRLPQTTEILRLLRDSNIESKRHAIYMIGKFGLKDLLPEVCACISIPGLEADSSIVLERFGNETSEELQRFFLNASGNLNTSKAILRILGKFNTQENSTFIFSRLWSNSRPLKEVALKCLINFGFKANSEEKDKLNQLISDTIGMITWNISAQVSLEKSNDTVLLEVIKKETKIWQSYLFNLLSITYDAGSVSKIWANIESGTVESINFALEMIDLVIDESIKAKLVSLIDAVPDEEKLKNLHQFFPGEVPKYEQLIDDILNRDYNFISIWAKAFTLRHITSIQGEGLRESVMALLFSPEKILQEETALLIGRTDKSFFDEVSGRISRASVTHLRKIVSGSLAESEMLFEKVVFLSNLLPKTPEDELINLAGSLIYFNPLVFAEMKEIPDSVVWNLKGDFSVTIVGTIFENNSSEFTDNQNISPESFIYLLPLNAIDNFRNLNPENSFEILDYLEKQENIK